MKAQNIRVSLLKEFKIIFLSALQQVNEHGLVSVSGYVTKEQSEYLLNQDLAGSKTVSIFVSDEETECKWFEGILASTSFQMENEKTIFSFTLATGTYFMDTVPHIRSFQSPGITYKHMFDILHKPYGNGAAFFHIGENTAIGHMVLQYMETDWEFAKRMASKFHTVLIPDANFAFPVYYIGCSKRSPKIEISTKTYSANKQMETYRNAVGKGCKGIFESDFIAYEYMTGEVYALGDMVNFNGKVLCVSKIESNLSSAELIHTYTFTSERGLTVPTVYNEKIIGLSLLASVTDVKKDRVSVSISNDENRGRSGSDFYPYATVYSSEDGTGWYFMPEVSDQVQIYFPTEHEKDVFVANSVHISGKEGNERSNPSVKSLMNKQKKEILFTPSSIKITNNAGMSVELNDGKGIEILSNKAIHINSEAAIDIKSNADMIKLTAPKEIRFKQGNTEMDLKEKMSLKGAQIRLD